MPLIKFYYELGFCLQTTPIMTIQYLLTEYFSNKFLLTKFYRKTSINMNKCCSFFFFFNQNHISFFISCMCCYRLVFTWALDLKTHPWHIYSLVIAVWCSLLWTEDNNLTDAEDCKSLLLLSPQRQTYIWSMTCWQTGIKWCHLLIGLCQVIHCQGTQVFMILA